MVHLSNFGYSMQIFSSKTSPSSFWLAFFLEFPDFFASLGFYRDFFDVPSKMLKEILNFQLFILKQVYGALAFLAFFYFPHLVPSQAICGPSLAGCWDHWSWIFELGPVLLCCVRARYFLFLLGDYSYFSPDSHDASRKIPSHTSRNSMGVTLNHRSPRQGAWEATCLSKFLIVEHLICPMKPPLNKNGCWNTKSTKRIKIREFHASNYRH